MIDVEAAPARDAALAYAAKGLLVFPLKPRTKTPATEHGFKDASADPAVIASWWDRTPLANVGTPTGISFDVADFDSGETWAWFVKGCRDAGIEPDSFPRVLTGKRGRHVLVAPTGLGNVDTHMKDFHWRGKGGYIVAPPSIHDETGRPYKWMIRPNGSYRTAPAFLLEQLRCPERPAAPPAVESSDRPPAAYIKAAVEAELEQLRAAPEGVRNIKLNDVAFAFGQMVAAGWIWRTAAEIDLEAAAIAAGLERDETLRTIRSGTEAGMKEPRKYAASPEAGASAEWRETQRARAERLGHQKESDTEPGDWGEIDLAPYRDGEPPPGPTMLPRADGVRLFYDGKLHWISGEPEGLKSWLAQIACGDAIMDGHHVIYVDFEDGPASVVDRLVNLGATWEAILAHFHYFRPETPMAAKGAVEHVLAAATANPPAIAVLDGVNASMGANDYDPNSSRDFYKWWQRFGAPLRKLTPGATVCIDHVVKNEENRKQYAAGTGQKLAAVDVHYGIEVTDPFGIGLTGRATISLLKDRPGMVQIHAGKRVQGRAPVGKLVMKSDPEAGEIRFQIEPPDVAATGGFRPTHLMEAVSKFVSRGHDGPLYKTTVIEGVPGKNQSVRLALSLLIEEGYVCAVPLGKYTGILELKKYREADDRGPGERIPWPLRRAGNEDRPRPSQTVPDRPRPSQTVPDRPRPSRDKTVPPSHP